MVDSVVNYFSMSTVTVTRSYHYSKSITTTSLQLPLNTFLLATHKYILYFHDVTTSALLGCFHFQQIKVHQK